MPNRESELAALMSSRICHDLVSPVGAVVNGIDLIREIGGGDVRDELNMISQSASRASTLLQCYRIAFGAAEGNDASIPRDALREQAEKLVGSARITITWAGIDGAAMSRAEARLLLQLLMCARAIVGMRGAIEVALSEPAVLPLRLVLHTTGNGALNAELVELIRRPGQPAARTARLVEFALVQHAAEALGAAISVDVSGASGALCVAPA